MDSDKARQGDLERFLEPRYLDLDEVLDAIEQEVAVSESRFRQPGLELRKCPPERRKLAIAISGGGAAGAYSAGQLEVLLDRLRKRGIQVGLLVGTSSGAVNGYGVFVEELDMRNPQYESDPAVQQPYESYIASVWSYLARDSKASRWVVGGRSWLVRLLARGLSSRWQIACIVIGLLLLAALLQPSLFLPLALVASRLRDPMSNWIDSSSLVDALPYLFGWSLVATAALGIAAALVFRKFRAGLFGDAPMLHLLANTGPQGDMRRARPTSRGQAVDEARVLSRDLVSAWYRRQSAAPEFIVAATDITASRGCLFTLVRPETYTGLLRHEWMTVQFGSDSHDTKAYSARSDALFTLSQNLLQALCASSAVPGAFPTQRIGLYGADKRRIAYHHFVDGGVLHTSPIHIAIDAGATHVISLEILPFGEKHSLQSDETGEEGYGALNAAMTTFATVLERATEEDIRHTASWNRFLTQRPGSMRPGKGTAKRQRRVVPIYRVAPREPLVGTVEFEGRFAGGRQAVTLRDLVRQGMLDMQGSNIWTATTAHDPSWHPPE